MIVFFAVANHDPKYFQTKHNIGRLVLEKISSSLNLSFSQGNGFFATKAKLQDETMFLVYSTGYMNNSGQALQSFLSFYKIDVKDATVLIFQDDSDQIEGRVKLVLGGGTAGHRGLDSIYQHLQIPIIRATRDQKDKPKIDLWRLKIGIRPVENKLKSETFVLKNISQIDEETVQNTASQLIEHLPLIAAKNMDRVQNYLNTGS
ncbi:MAG: aminoacyl-tRNA hydrolase [bacterium]